ncbi:MAG TPA: hypothetical protein VHP11_02030 [Tepidisphaeraceae bacterium]|nr:hypothetical protein [Tepidisphaeraceae bacterium]
MLWVVRGTYEQSNEDVSIVVDVESSAEAQYIARRRGIPVVVVGPATDEDVAVARKAKRLFVWRRQQAYTCWGRPVGKFQLACLMLCGIFTAMAVLNSAHVLG